MIVLLRTDGTSEKISDTDPGLETLQNLVGGLIEIVPLIKDDVIEKELVVNEEGKLLQLPLNIVASIIYNKYYPGYDVIVGDALLCDPGDIK